mmetsp:Transcript_11704/g.49273  ORF Transcript_11704/g.49273 Transcript_11704/m.49273 type:complete len:202 (+) Transcript_11704:235-840(+)
MRARVYARGVSQVVAPTPVPHLSRLVTTSMCPPVSPPVTQGSGMSPLPLSLARFLSDEWRPPPPLFRLRAWLALVPACLCCSRPARPSDPLEVPPSDTSRPAQSKSSASVCACAEPVLPAAPRPPPLCLCCRRRPLRRRLCEPELRRRRLLAMCMASEDAMLSVCNDGDMDASAPLSPRECVRSESESPSLKKVPRGQYSA